MLNQISGEKREFEIILKCRLPVSKYSSRANWLSNVMDLPQQNKILRLFDEKIRHG